MTKVSADVVQDFTRLSAAQKKDLLAKLQRYVERGQWAAQKLQEIAAITQKPEPSAPEPQ